MNKITFVCPCYNHEKYVLDFLNSLLAQTNPNWELLIFDDCSKDETVKAIRSVQDARIHLIQNPYNKGMAFAVSEGIKLAKTEIVSFVASDDRLYSDYVKNILKAFTDNPKIAACYTPLKHMNQEGKLMDSMTPLPMDRAESEIFAHMFLNENLLPSPGMAFKKSILLPYLPLDLGMIQYTDWQLHFFLMYQHQIKLLDKPLVQYRVAQGSASTRSPNVILREEIETKKLMDTVIDLIGKDKSIFLNYFGNYPLIQKNEIDSETIPFWLGRLALTSSIEAKQKWGLQTIMSFIAKSENLDLLHHLYNFSYKDYIGYAALVKNSLSQEHISIKKYKRKIQKLKKFIVVLIMLCLVLGGLLCL